MVKVTPVVARDVPIYKEWVGTLAAQVSARIRALVSGYLLTRDYAEGSRVQKGDLLFEIDPRPFQAALDQAQAKLAQDRAQAARTSWTVQRYAPLAKQKAISEQEYHDAVQANAAAEAQVEADQAAVEAAQLNLGYTRITAPITGLADVAQAQIGDLVGPSGPVLTTVSDIDPIRVYFNVSEQAYLAYRHRYTNELARASHEQNVTLQLILADGSVYPRPGSFYFAGAEVSPTTGTIQIAGLFPNPSYLLRPGQFARVRAMTQLERGALVVPQQAVTQLQGMYQVALVDAQNRVHVQAVSVGPRVGSQWVIEQGLKPGQRVVVEGTEKVREGMLVNPQPLSTPPPPE